MLSINKSFPAFVVSLSRLDCFPFIYPARKNTLAVYCLLKPTTILFFFQPKSQKSHFTDTLHVVNQQIRAKGVL